MEVQSEYFRSHTPLKMLKPTCVSCGGMDELQGKKKKEKSDNNVIPLKDFVRFGEKKKKKVHMYAELKNLI